MALQFHPLPVEVFGVSAQPYIARLNRELRDVFGLEGVMRNPIATRRSDATILRRSEPQVDVSRITPSITTVVSGSSTVVGTPALILDTTNLVGTTTTAIAVDSTVALFGTQAPSNIAASAAVGTSAFAARADHVHRWPSALATEASELDSITLTDDASSGALLTASNSFAVNLLSLQAPNAMNALTVGKYGNIAIAGIPATTDQYLMSFTKQDFNEAVTGPVGIAFTITNQNIGDGQGLLRGMNAAITGSMSSATAPSFRNAEGIRLTMTGGAAGNSLFQGSLFAYRNASNSIASSLVGTTVVSIVDFQSSNANVIQRSLVDTRISFEAKGAVTLLTSGVLNNHYGFLCNSLTGGNTRIQYRSAAITTGTPAISISFQSLLHSVGTLRRSFYGENTAEFGRDILVGSTGGIVFKDTQATSRWWRQTITATGNTGGSISIDENGFVSGIRTALATGAITVNINDTGTTIQAT